MMTNKEIRIECLKMSLDTIEKEKDYNGTYQEPYDRAEKLFEFIVKESAPGPRKKK